MTWNDAIQYCWYNKIIETAHCEPTSYIVTVNSFKLKFVLAWIKHRQTKSLSSVAHFLFFFSLVAPHASQGACVHILMPCRQRSFTRLGTEMWGRNPEWELDVWPLWPQETALTRQSVTSWDAHTARRLALSPRLDPNPVSLAPLFPFVPLCAALNETLPRFNFLLLLLFL